MLTGWCQVCSTQHARAADCPGDLMPTAPEEVGWRVNVDTGSGVEGVGVLLAPCGELWRARVMTFPNILWLAPGGRATMKFVGPSADVAKQGAIRFVRAHCASRGHEIRHVAVGEAENGRARAERSVGRIAPRKFRFLDVRFGVVHPSESAEIGNLSETGLFIMTDAPLDRGTELNLSLRIDEADLELAGRVVWMRSGHHAGGTPGMGVQLSAPPPQYLEYVRALD